MRDVEVPEQPGVVALGQRGHPTLAERGLELVLVVAGDVVGLVEEEHAGILARVQRQVPDACQAWRRSDRADRDVVLRVEAVAALLLRGAVLGVVAPGGFGVRRTRR